MLYYLGADHLASTSVVLDAAGSLVAESRHLPYGGIRWESDTLPTDLRFTGEKWEAALGLYHMGARWYDPSLNRWISPDVIVPDPADPQSLNRLSYVRNRPLRFSDPTGYFDEEAQLKEWFGEDWRSLFNAIWQEILLEAEFGDVLLYGLDESAMFVQAGNGALTMWTMSKSEEFSGRGDVSIFSVANRGVTGLYRSRLANENGGPTQGHHENIWATDPRFRAFERIGAWEPAAPGSITLGYNWYRSAQTNQNIAVRTKFCGFKVGIGDLWDLGKDAAFYYGARGAIKFGVKQGFKALAVALGGTISGPLGIAIGAQEVYSWTRWDTSFSLNSSGPGLPPIVPASLP